MPKIEDYLCRLNDTSSVLGFGAATQENCQELDEFFGFMTTNHSNTTDFLRLACANDQKKNLTERAGYEHLKLFYMFVPCLTLTFIHNQVTAKERLLKKNFQGGYISDDGFILGVYYMLEI